ncbi:MAG: hypothetical protein PHQ46_06840 [Negativicutes bacterium]|nr:hypothetical protein [Negativicutes bacterium]
MASNNQTLTIRPDASLRAKLEEFANARGISLTAAINIILFEMLGANKNEEKGA